MQSSGELRRVKKYRIDFQNKGEDYKFNLCVCSRGDSTALPLVSTGFHRGLDRTLCLGISAMKEKHLINDKEIICALLDSGVMSRNTLAFHVAMWEPKKQ